MNNKWDAFLESDPHNPKIFAKIGNRLYYESEQLVPKKRDDRPPSPAWFSAILQANRLQTACSFPLKEMGPNTAFGDTFSRIQGALELSYDRNRPVDDLNKIRQRQLLDLAYDSSYRIGLCVFITLPSAPGGSWGGVAGVQKLIGVKALRKLEQEESTRVLKLAEKFINAKGAVIAFQKNAWNGLRSEKDPEYSIEAARAGSLEGTLKGRNDLAVLCVPPTRLAGPCCRVLTQMLKNIECRVQND